MEQKQQRKDPPVDFYVLPLLGGAIVGFVIGELIGVTGILGTLIGAFVVDALRGLQGTHRFVKEAEHLVQLARKKQKGQRSIPDTPESKDPAQSAPSEKPTKSEEQPPS
jgi:hypothetical protein